ncbi:alpha/beta hydrolase [Acinetobacter zhairhuonensis]|jgi:acetyl esterase/lipase|uniref:alpha/beta hydrolase n=1 Tax=Acinetobacter sp. A7.4 TaxID=2919921 RepID=UPI001F4E3C6C|nr:alpha/beta hydrolase [Acinetobacter sp. A7.4]MCJ8160875.1 alpha/beta hydrolase [Acinetobacter sp. A7.4]
MNISAPWKQFITESLLKTAVRTPSQYSLPPKTLRLGLEQLCRVFPMQPDVQVRSLRLGQLNAEELKPQQQSTQLIFHIHGGVFFLGSLKTHRAFLSQIAARTQMQVLHVDYPLSPEHPFPEAVDALFEVYLNLLNQGIQAKDIILSGDSCGANLAVALAIKIRQAQREQVSGLILLSPFLDLTLTSESLRFNQKHDALLSIEALETGIAYYLPKEIDRGDPRVSPVFEDLTGLPPTLIQVGSKEILMDDGKRFQQQAQAAGVDVEFKIYTGMWHNFQMFSAWFEEAQQALADLATFAHRLDHD